MKRLFFIIIFFTTNATLPIYAGEQYYIDRLSTQNGLRQNDVLDIIQDSYGFIWMATYDGVTRYDGYDFLSYSSGDVGLDSNMTLCMAEDKDRNIWIGTNDKGLFYYVRKENHFYHHSELTDNPRYHSLNVRRVAVGADGYIWCYNRWQGNITRFRFDSATKKIVDEQIFKPPYKGAWDITIITPLDDEIYLGTKSGLYRFSDKNDKFIHINAKDSLQNVRSITKRNDLLFVASGNRLLTINPSTGESKQHLTITAPFYLCYVNDYLWIASQQGVYKTEYNFRKDHLSPKIDTIESYNNITPQSIVSDHANGVWVGRQKRGANRYSLNRKPFHTNKSVEGLNTAYIHAANDGSLLIGSGGNGLYRLDSTNNLGGMSKDASRSRLLSSRATILSIGESEKYTYISTTIGVYRATAKSCELLFDDATAYMVLPDGEYLWMATVNDGLIRYNLKDKTAIYLTQQNSPLPSSIVRNAIKDREQNIWVTTSKGVAKISHNERLKERPEVTLITTHNEDKHLSIPIIEDSRGDIWYGTLGHGVVRISGDTATRYTKSDGLDSNIIKAIEEDNNGAIWLSTAQGLNQLVVGSEELHIKSFDLSEVLQDCEFNELSSAKLADGTLLFGSPSTLCYFNPYDFTSDQTPLRAVITDFKIDSRSIYKESTQDDLLESQHITLDHTQNNFTIEFAALHFSTPSKYLYRYRLEGFDKKWITQGAEFREARYSNLSPGDYTFHLQVRNEDGEWEERELTTSITINYPVWQRWYALLLYAALAVIAIYYIARNIRMVARRRNAMKIAHFERQKMEEMLQMRTRFFTNVSHEFRTPLTLILSPLQCLMESEQVATDHRTRELLETMSHNGESLMRLINEFLNYTKQESGELKAQRAMGDFAAHSRRLFLQFNYLAQKRGITLQCNTPKEGIMVDYDPFLMEQVIYNLVSNAIKHTPEGGKISLTTEVCGELVLLSVQDNGCGIPYAEQEQVFEQFFSRASENSKGSGGTGIGLYLTRKLVELHQGRVWAESTPNIGTTFFVEFPRGCKESVACAESIAETIHPKERAESQQESPRSTTLLIIDDNAEMLHLLNQLFMDEYKILLAHDGVEGWEVASQMLPDIIISDVMMPRMDGIELCERLKGDTTTSHIPVILLSAKSSAEDITQGLRATADGYCPKPFNNMVLKELIKSTLINRQKIAARAHVAKESEENGELSFPDLSSVATTQSDKLFLTKLTQYIEENIQKSELTATDICDYMGMTSFILNKKLKALLGMTIVVLIRTIRLRAAATLLRNSDLNVTEVIYDVGFSDMKYFRRCFKEEFGLLPQEYKNKVRD